MLKQNINPVVFEDIESVVSTRLNWERFKNKTILITGANGFIASYLVYTFLYLNEKKNINCKIVGVSRNKIKAEARFQSLLERNDLQIIIADVSQSFRIEEKADFIIHAASQASPKYYGTDPVGTLNANVLGTNNLLELAKKNNAESFLFFSSAEVYGSVEADKIPVKEHDFGYLDINNVRSCYAEGKRLGETMCVSWAQQYKIPVKIVRPFHTYGPGMDLQDGRVYADFIADVVNNRNIVMKSDGLATRAFCYLKDATEAFIKVLLDGENGEAYNVGNPDEEISVVDLAEKLTALFPEKKLVVDKQTVSDAGYLKSVIVRSSPDVQKIRVLGWKPSTSVSDGFTRTIKSYLS